MNDQQTTPIGVAKIREALYSCRGELSARSILHPGDQERMKLIDEAVAAWDAAKASSPSVTAPNGSDVNNLHNAAREMRLQLCEFRAAAKIPDRTWFKWNAALEATEHVLSLSPAAQGVTVDQDWRWSGAGRWMRRW